ncbi:hypothetical protein DWW15_09750 [Subdoligranulum sp. AF14-43]|nr:hypothetical protein DWW15_09750 [Subdoligranulum sp. AF14-43]
MIFKFMDNLLFNNGKPCLLCAAVKRFARPFKQRCGPKAVPLWTMNAPRTGAAQRRTRPGSRIRRCAGNAASGALQLFQVAYFV